MDFSKIVGAINGINEISTLCKMVKDIIKSRWSGIREQELQDKVMKLENDLERLRDILPAMYNLIDRAEWTIHKDHVPELLLKLKDAVYDAEDLLDELKWHELKVAMEGSANKSPLIDFLDSVIQGSFNKVSGTYEKLNNVSSLLEKMGLHEVTQHFDKSFRPETTSFPTETEMFGRDNELEQVMQSLGVPAKGSRVLSKRKKPRSAINALPSTSKTKQHNGTQMSDESGITCIPVLPIYGIGGVGKTTLAQHICHDSRVKSHFDLIIWICVSDDFDVKRLTKEAIQSCSTKEADNLDYLQRALSEEVMNKRLLIILDDMWGDVSRESGHCWKRFCAPLTNALQGSMMLVTTRSPDVAREVQTMEPIRLEGLQDDVFWDFFKLCAFGSKNSENYPELVHIGKSIVQKLKGVPLATETLGRLLRMSLDTEYWNRILKSELWELKQNNTEILPALRLSYLYLPTHLKRCFSFCAVYPKDHKFEEDNLAEIWIAEGFVQPEGNTPILDTGKQYFEDLVNLSFFQSVGGNKYVIHDLLHDMAQLVSKDDCFILKDKDDFEKVPPSVRHLFVLPSIAFDCTQLLSLSRKCKLESLPGDFSKLCNLQRFESCGFNCLPNGESHFDASTGQGVGLTLMKNVNQICGGVTINNLGAISKDIAAESAIKNKKNLDRLNLKWSSVRSQDHNDIEVLQVLIPPTSLKCLTLNGYLGQSLPNWFHPHNLPSLKSLEFHDCHRLCSLPFCGISPPCINLNEVPEVPIENACIPAIKRITLQRLTYTKTKVLPLPIGKFDCLEELDVAGYQIFNASESLSMRTLKELKLCNSGDLPCFFEFPSLTNMLLVVLPVTSIPLRVWCSNLPALLRLKIYQCMNLEFIGESVFTGNRPQRDSCSTTTFSSLTFLEIYGCEKLRSIGDLVTPEYLPAIEKFVVTFCGKLSSLPGERFGNFSALKHLDITSCGKLKWKGLVLPSTLQSLCLSDCGDISPWVPSCLENLASLVRC
uniref:NB-ARC domain-containing protein n=1 Tax=Oryza glumipatula TaxID=40148 RepID=A0A0D9YQI6_9ORYZ